MKFIFLTSLLFASLSTAQHNHGGSTTTSGELGVNALMGEFHTKLGIDQLWFSGWVPTSSGSTFASAFGLFLLAVFSRLLSAARSQLDQQWAIKGRVLRRQALENSTSGNSSGIDGGNFGNISQRKIEGNNKSSSNERLTKRLEKIKDSSFPPFIFSHDIPRGLFQILQSGIGYLLMLAVMMGNVWWFIGTLLGLGIGEVLFGRFTHVHIEDHH